jgi:glycosyltransferase involved in cell wall biosynthesis
MKEKNILIIIPTHNEAENIKETIEALNIVRAQLVNNKNLSVLIFDSASTDSTVSIIQDLCFKYEWLSLTQESKKTGLGSAYYQAMKYAISYLKVDVVIEFDADLSHQPKYIANMLDLIDAHDVVIGSRYVAEGKIPSSWALYRKAISYFGNWLTRLVLTSKYKDFTSGFRATRVEILKQVIQEPFITQNYGYKLDLLWRLHLINANIIEFPIEFIDREKGKSKLPQNSIIESLIVILKLRYQTMFGKI